MNERIENGIKIHANDAVYPDITRFTERANVGSLSSIGFGKRLLCERHHLI